jgi:hypothetical protein
MENNNQITIYENYAELIVIVKEQECGRVLLDIDDLFKIANIDGE